MDFEVMAGFYLCPEAAIVNFIMRLPAPSPKVHHYAEQTK